MAKQEKFSTAASAGFMPFSLADVQETWANIRDGNYWSAFRRIIRIMDDVLNPETGRTAVNEWTPETGEQIDDVLAEMEQWRDDMSHSVGSKVVTVRPELSEHNGTAIPITELITLVTLLIQIAREWRKRRSNPTETPVQGVTGNDPMRGTLNLGTTVQGKPRVRGPVFPPNVEVKDKEEAAQNQRTASTSTNAGQPATNAPAGPKTAATSTVDPKRTQPAKPQQQPMTGNEPKPVDPTQPTTPDTPEVEQVESENEGEEGNDSTEGNEAGNDAAGTQQPTNPTIRTVRPGVPQRPAQTPSRTQQPPRTPPQGGNPPTRR